MLVKGFTLIELLITIAIIGILYALALPAYSQFVQDGRRADVQQMLLQYAVVLERQYTRMGGYPDSSSVATNTDFYTFSYTPSTSAAATTTILFDSKTFILTATPVVGSSQGNDPCGSLSVNHRGEKTTDKTKTDCWKK